MRDIALTARRLCLLAGAETMALFRADGLEVDRKSDMSPVTAADRAADGVIVAGLEAAHPEIPVVTEERADSFAAAGAPRFFLVDPLDGTKEFISGRGEFTVN
ncbi:MAG: inositol monophosphatase family protein, partial [Pseudomonadota bacterium]